MFGKRAILPLILIIASIVLLVFNIIELNRDEGAGSIYGPVSNILLIIGMVMVIIGNRKSSGEK